MQSLLLVGFCEQAQKLLIAWKEIAEKQRYHVIGYKSIREGINSDPIEILGITTYYEVGDWLKTVELVVPFLPSNAPETWHHTLADCSILDKKIMSLRKQKTQKSEPPCCWINTIDPKNANMELKILYDDLICAHGKLHNLYRAFSLQPAPLKHADRHYRAVLHDPNLISEPWFLELLSSQAAILAGCKYALVNHGENFINLLGDRHLGERMLIALERRDYVTLFDPKHSELLSFGEKLCLRPHAVDETSIMKLRDIGASDTEILESVQAIACFAYWTRFINGLGISLGGETIGRQDVKRA